MSLQRGTLKRLHGLKTMKRKQMHKYRNSGKADNSTESSIKGFLKATLKK